MFASSSTRRPSIGRGWFVTALAMAAALSMGVGGAHAESISILGPGAAVAPNSTFSTLIVLRDNATPLTGYTLDLDVTPLAGAVGSLTGNAGLSNFYPPRNLIEKDPTETLHPLFSVIAPQVDGGLFVNAQSFSGLPVDLALPGYSDVLAQVYFNVPANALGSFQISLGSATTLFDGSHAVPYDADVLNVEVVPEPTGWVVSALGTLLAARRRRPGR